MDSSSHFKHLVDIALRRKWWVVVPAVLAIATSLVIVSVTPNVYQATTTILVTRQGVPEDMARGSVTLHIEERMRSLELQILSRSYLEQVARKLEMVPANASEAEIEESCGKLRAQVVPELDGQNFSWFRISVEDDDPERAAGIANQLAGLFIEQNSKIRASQATETLGTTENWEQKYRLELVERDKKIEEFTKQNLHQLPEQQTANVQFLYDAKNRFAQLTSDIRSANDRLVALRAQADAQRTIDILPGRTDVAVGAETGRLATLKRELAELRVNYTEENPLVKRRRTQIAELVRSLPIAAATGAPASPRIATAFDPISVQITAIENEIEQRESERTRENAKILAYGARIGNSPQIQPKLLELTRDSDQAKRQLDLAVVQNEQARHAQDLEGSKTGEQFQIQDRAYPPTVPIKPNVYEYVIAGIAFGLLLGVGAAAGREFVDQTLRSEDEFAAVFPDLSVYGVIPSLDADLKSSLGSYAYGREAGRLA